MLGKLIKHDMKALSRYFIPLHAFVLIIALIGRIFVTTRLRVTADGPNFFIILYAIAFTLVLTSICTGTYIIIGIHFYRNLFSARGYLTWTLPATSGQKLISKTITAYIWAVIDFIVMIASAFIVLWVSEIPWDIVVREFEVELGLSFGSFFAAICFVGLIGSLCGVVSIYAAIALGQLFSNHRVLAAIIMYGVINLFVQVIVIILMFVSPNGYGRLMLQSADIIASNWGTEFYSMMGISAIASLVEAIVFYILTHYIMSNKTNLI